METGLIARMLSGFNTNFRYRAVLFHVQTEDSGRDKPRVFTHLFKGGDILATLKADYSDKLDSPKLEVEVRTLMESQHKTMLRELSRGVHDAAIIERMGADVFGDESGSVTDATIPPPEVSESENSTETQPDFEAPAKAEPGAAGVAGTDTPKERIARAFGDGVVSQRPLDEVVLDYLVDNARKRKRPPK